jgi:hypothetical protein
MIDVSQLTDEQAISAANFVVQEWTKNARSEAIALWKAIGKARKIEEPLETWLLDPKPTDPDVAYVCRQMLQSFLESPEGKEPSFCNWAQQGIEQATTAQAQVLDPLSLVIGGTLLIGLVLAVRVEDVEVGKQGFKAKLTKGLPDSVVNLVNAVSSVVTFS